MIPTDAHGSLEARRQPLRAEWCDPEMPRETDLRRQTLFHDCFVTSESGVLLVARRSRSGDECRDVGFRRSRLLRDCRLEGEKKSQHGLALYAAASVLVSRLVPRARSNHFAVACVIPSDHLKERP